MMKELPSNWLTQGLIDFEYKKYLLLAYMQGVTSEFDKRNLYPVFSNLLFHYENLIQLKENKKLLVENFPKELARADFDQLALFYKEVVKDDAIMSELEAIMAFSIPVFQNHLSKGKSIYEEIEYSISITPVGLFSLNHESGYLFFHVENIKETKIYEYELTLFERANEKYRGIHTHYVETVSKNLNNTFESIKVYVAKKYKKMANPATYLVDAKLLYPFNEALLPVAKRMLVQELYKNDQV